MAFWRKDVIQPGLDREAETAEAEQRAILARDPHNARAHFALGALAHLRGDTDGAILHYRQAIELDPSYAAPHVSLGRICAVQGLDEEAWREARAAERLGDHSLADQLTRYLQPGP